MAERPEYKKGENSYMVSINELGAAAIALVIAAFLISIGATVIDELQDTQTSNSIAYNVSTEGLEAMETFGNWLPIIAIVVAAVVVIGLLVVYLGGLGGRM